jgi:hypothetical protein
MKARYCVLGFIVALCACSTRQTVTEISSKSTSDPPGIPFRVLSPYTVRVFLKDKNGDYQQGFVQSQDLPDQSRLFAINVKSEFFSNHQLQLNLNNDSTLNASSITTTITAAPAISAAGTQLSAVGDSIVNFNNNQRAQQIANLQSQTSLQQQQLAFAQAVAALQKQLQAPHAAKEAALVAALQALNAAQAAQRLVDDPPAGTTPTQQANNEANLRLAELQANQAFEAAGLQDPYPGIFPGSGGRIGSLQ